MKSFFLVLLCLMTVIIGTTTAQIITSFPYTETFDTASPCADCSTGGLETDCLTIESELGWVQEVAQDTANTNWIVWDQDAPTAGTGPKGGDHTSGSGNYLWLHQGTGRANNGDDDDGAPYCETDPTAFYNQTVGILSPVFDFSAVAASDSIFLRVWAWIYGLRVGVLTVQYSVTADVDGPWIDTVISQGIDLDQWVEHVVALPLNGFSATRLRFLVTFLPNVCPSGCTSGGVTPAPADMADVAFDDVQVFLSSNAPTITAGTEDRAVWLDLTIRDGLDGILPFMTDHQAAWSDVASPSFGDHRLLTWGGISSTGEAIDRSMIFDYEARSISQDLETGVTPIPRRRAGHVILGGVNATQGRLLMYGGSGKFGLTPNLLMLSLVDGSFEPVSSALNCTNLDVSNPSHLSFPSEGSQAVLDPLDTTRMYVTMGRSLVVQINFVTEYLVDAVSGSCTGQVLRPTSGPSPPLPRWDHVTEAWSGVNGNRTYVVVFGGRFQPADGDTPQLLNDFHLFDTVAEEWLGQLTVADPSQLPAARSGAAAANNKAGDKMVLFGGQNDLLDLVYSDVYVLQYDLSFQLWKRLSPGLDVSTVPGRWGHTMVPMFFPDRTLDPTAPDSQVSEGFLIYGGVVAGGLVTNHMAKLHFGSLSLPPVSTDGDDEDEPIVAIILGVLMPFCCLLLLLLLALAMAVGILMTWRSVMKKRLKKRYGIGQDIDLAEM